MLHNEQPILFGQLNGGSRILNGNFAFALGPLAGAAGTGSIFNLAAAVAVEYNGQVSLVGKRVASELIELLNGKGLASGGNL